MSHANFYRNRLFHKLPESLADRLFEAGEVSVIPAGAVVINEGERLNRLFIVLSGNAELDLFSFS